MIELTPETARNVQIVWTAGLVIALIVTLIDVSLLFRVIRAARKIDGLAGRTLPAAVGIVENTSSLKNLAATNDVAAALMANALPIVAVADSMDKKLAAVSAFAGGGQK
ncbi:MAG: hypothetical protein WKF92_09250 [Pyrinomonadaceae bacterium]